MTYRPRPPRKKPFDWLKFCIHGFFGAVLGAITGLTVSFFIGFFYNCNDLLAMGIGAVVYALVAGIKGDEFWGSLG